MEEVKKLLDKYGYKLTLKIDKENDKIIFNIPTRVVAPFITEYTVEYSIGEDSFTYQTDEDKVTTECPQYACRLLILYDVRRHCLHLDYDTNLLDFFVGSDKVDEEEFFRQMWPKNIQYDDLTRTMEYNLKDLLGRAQNAIIPFHQSFSFEAQQLGVEFGYFVIRSFAFGEDNE